MRTCINRLILSLLVLSLAPLIALAGPDRWNWDQDEDQDDNYKWKTWKTQRSHGGFNGFGGFFFNMQTFESGDIERLATSMGLDTPGEFIPTWGGLGMGHVGSGWRIGGGGYGGHVKTDGVYVATDGSKYNRSLEMSIGAGGFMVEYSPWMVGPVNFGFGSTLGWGGVAITMSQDTGTYTWKDLYLQYIDDPKDGENIRTEIDQGFLLAEPYFTVRVHILDWMALQGTAGWTLTSMNTSNWEFNNNELTGDGPDIDLNRPFYRFGLVFGG